MSYPLNVSDFDAGDWIKVFIPPIVMFIEIAIISCRYHEIFKEKFDHLFKKFKFNQLFIKIIWFLLSWCIGFSWGFAGNTTLSYIFFISLLVCIISWAVTFAFLRSPIYSYYLIYIAVTLSSLIWAEGPKKSALCIIPFLTWLAFSASFNYYVVIYDNPY